MLDQYPTIFSVVTLYVGVLSLPWYWWTVALICFWESTWTVL